MVKQHRFYYFSLNVPYHQCYALYTSMPNVVLTAETGERVQIPQGRIKAMIDSRGLVGRFRLTVDETNKCKEFVRVN